MPVLGKEARKSMLPEISGGNVPFSNSIIASKFKNTYAFSPNYLLLRNKININQGNLSREIYSILPAAAKKKRKERDCLS